MWGSELLYVPKFLENFKGPNFLCFLNLRIWSSPKYKVSCHIIGLYSVGMDSDQLVCVLLLVLGRKIPAFYFSSKIFYSRTRLWVKWQEWRLSDFLLLWTIQLTSWAFQLVCLYKQVNQLIFENSTFCSWAQLESPSKCPKGFLIAIRLREEKCIWMKRPCWT